MIFRKTLLSALLVGLVAGLVFSLIQYWVVNPIILEAETFEVQSGHDHSAHGHLIEAGEPLDQQKWAPQNGAERTSFSVLANIIAGVGYAAILLALMAQFQQQGLVQLSRLKGLIWAAAGFITFFAAPGLGLPPEIPGMEAEALDHRQIWWLMCVLCVGTGILLLGLGVSKIKLLGPVLLVLPYLVAIPHGGEPVFSHPDAQTVLTLTHLHHQFIIVSGLANLLFWLIIGVASAWILDTWVLKGDKVILDKKAQKEGGIFGA